MKIIILLILISFISCESSIIVIKGDSNEIDLKQRMDSLQLQKNEFKPPLRW